MPLHSQGCLDFSPYSPAEGTGRTDAPLPTRDQLDYALLRLAQPVGQQSINGNARHWISVASIRPHLVRTRRCSSCSIVKIRRMLAMDADAVIGVNQNGTRVRYTTNTGPGSSGAPCFTMEWDLVALHHRGDPAWVAPKYNEGVPIGLIRDRILSRGFARFLGR